MRVEIKILKTFFWNLNCIDNLIRSKYYIEKALRKVVNYKSPYNEYFKEIADFTQNSIDYFYEKRKEKKSHFCSPISQTIAEENENENLSQSPKQKIGDYQIFINNINYKEITKEKISSVEPIFHSNIAKIEKKKESNLELKNTGSFLILMAF